MPEFGTTDLFIGCITGGTWGVVTNVKVKRAWTNKNELANQAGEFDAVVQYGYKAEVSFTYRYKRSPTGDPITAIEAGTLMTLTDDGSDAQIPGKILLDSVETAQEAPAKEMTVDCTGTYYPGITDFALAT